MSTTNVSINKLVNNINEYNNNPLAVLTYISEEIFPWMTAIFHAMSIETFMATLGTISDDFFEFKGIEMDDAREYMRELCRIQEDIHKAFPFNTDNRKDGE